MTVKEYLLSGKANLSSVASKMYPNNKNAIAYLSRKLHGKDKRSFTKKDAEKAINALREICKETDKLTIS